MVLQWDVWLGCCSSWHERLHPLCVSLQVSGHQLHYQDMSQRALCRDECSGTTGPQRVHIFVKLCIAARCAEIVPADIEKSHAVLVMSDLSIYRGDYYSGAVYGKHQPQPVPGRLRSPRMALQAD